VGEQLRPVGRERGACVENERIALVSLFMIVLIKGLTYLLVLAEQRDQARRKDRDRPGVPVITTRPDGTSDQSLKCNQWLKELAGCLASEHDLQFQEYLLLACALARGIADLTCNLDDEIEARKLESIMQRYRKSR